MHETTFRPTRRTFLLSAASSFGGLTLTPQCFAMADRSRKLPRLSLVVVSDTHLGYRDKEHAARLWEQTAVEIGKSSAELVLHLGDIVDGGRELQYPIYLKTREKIGKPVHEIPGNHDPQPLFEKYIRQPVDTVVEHKWLRFLLLNNARSDSHDGFISDDQLAWLETSCKEAENDGTYVALCMHVPAHTNQHPDRGWYVKPEHGQHELYNLLTRHRDRILCLMHGHFHNGIRGWEDHRPVHEIVFPSALYNQSRRLEEQNAPGYNLPEFRPGYTLITIDDGQMRLRYQPVGTADSVEKTCQLVSLKSMQKQQ
ncbi:metallophosphoesterase family protein [Thalassoroseus pseudoceratinae]|uniref:metallophosphoesterase family protein n=1 Tax=Thalassoroseus pseudoceratinae TaxID=2713176 RepID=UPI00142212A7|nr:metallophosphoesterase [Thalassoroseus pseudoceratinae]